jgi:hypothetical protein
MMRRNDFKKPILCLVVWCIILLVSIDISTATWSPHQHPSNLSSLSSSSSTTTSQRNYHSSHNNNNNNNNNIERAAVRRQQYIINGDTPRGGSTILQPPPPPPPLHMSQERHESDFGTQQEQDDYHRRDDHNYHHYNSPEHHHRQDQDQNQGQNQEERTTFFSPKIHLKHVAEALLRTSEWNRRLRQGLKYWGTRHLKRYNNNNNNNIEYHQQQHQYKDQQQDLHDNFYPQHQNLHQNVPVNVHPSRTWQPPIQSSSGRLLEDEELSLFHAKIPHPRRSLSSSSSDIVNENGYDKFEEEKDVDDDNDEEEEEQEEVTKKHDELYDENDIRYWGPDILPYLEYICDKLGIDKNGIEVSLAMIYMDRACSVETSRSNGVPACPFCTPRTVHRLSLAAFLISLQAVRGQTGGGGEQQQQQFEQQYQQLQLLSVSLGIPLLQLEQMVEWMRSALGDSGLFVTMEEMISWNRSLEMIFSSSK